jgi:outer membrane protein assembly factor BamB
MKKRYYKTKLSTIPLILVLAISAIFVTLPAATAQDVPSRATHAYIGAVPNPVGVNQIVLLHVGITQQLVSYQYGWEDLTVSVRDPEGIESTLHVDKTDATGGTGVVFTPNKVGTYILQTHFPEQVMPATLGAISAGTVMKASTSKELELVVQTEQIEYYPGHSLPSEYWTRPIDAQLREWKVIAGNWLARPLDSQFAPYNDGPETAHILWAKPLTMGGLVGGDLDNHAMACGDAYEGKWATSTRGSVIINGVLYYNRHESTGGTAVEQEVVAVDLHTGEELWIKTLLNNVQLSFGQVMYWDTLQYHGAYAYLWATSGSTWMAFDAFTGRWVYNITGVPSGSNIYGPKGEILRYIVNLRNGWMAKWNSTATYYLTLMEETGNDQYPSGRWRPQGRTFDASYGIEWNVTIPTDLPGSVVEVLDDRVIGASITNTEVTLWGLSVEAGNEGTELFTNTWNAPAEWAAGNLSISWLAASQEDGVGVLWSKEGVQYWGVSLDTGEQIWGPTDPQHYLNFLAGNLAKYIVGIAYGKLFATGYGGIVYAYDIKTGKLLWTYDAADPYQEILWSNSWPLYMAFITDGKVYLVHAEHSVIDPKPRGAPFICLDAEDGDVIFRADGLLRSTHWGGRAIIGDSIIAMYNTYDQRVYAIGKGSSATTVTASPKVVAKGTSVIIEGTVMDVSPGTEDAALQLRFPNGVPAISDEDMSEWMNYVYTQFEIPADPTGVDVYIDVVSPDGTWSSLGKVTSDMSGMYSYMWTPPAEGKYTIVATFMGSGGYYASYAETTVGVDPAPTPSGSITPEEEAPLITTEIAIILAVVAVAVIGLVGYWALKKRK